MVFLPQEVELLTSILSFVFTIALLSYLIGDNPLYRTALHTFIGVLVGYTTLVVLFDVIGPRIIQPILTGNSLVAGLALVPMLLFVLLFFKLGPVTTAVGNISVAYLVGIGAAVAIGGAIQGTLFPQAQATWRLAGNSFFSGIIALIITVAALLSFQFTRIKVEENDDGPQQEARINRIFDGVAGVGKMIISAALGAVYAGVILTGLAVFSGQLTSLSQLFASILP